MSQSNSLKQSFDTALAVITDPKGFYQSMPKSGGFEAPILFVVLMALAAAAVTFFWSILHMGPMSGLGVAAVSFFIVYPLGLLVACFMLGGVAFGIWRLMGSDLPYEVSFRCVSFSTAIVPVLAVMSLVPFVATVVQPLWACYLMYLASTQVHGRSDDSSQLVFGVIALVLTLGAIF